MRYSLGPMVLRWVTFAVTALLFGCGAEYGEGLETGQTRQALVCTSGCEFDLPVPAGRAPSEFAVGANHRLVLNDGTSARVSVGGAGAAVANVGTSYHWHRCLGDRG
jgi:hypothetical protein